MRRSPMRFGDPCDLNTSMRRSFNFAPSVSVRHGLGRTTCQVTTGTHVLPKFASSCLPHRDGCRDVSSSAPRFDTRGAQEKIKIIDLDLSRYDRIGSRFHRAREAADRGRHRNANTAFTPSLSTALSRSRSHARPTLADGADGAGNPRLAPNLRAKKGAPRCERRVVM